MTQRILVVDDEPQITRVLRTTLESNGYAVTIATDGADALRKFNAVCLGIRRRPSARIPSCPHHPTA